MKKLLFIVLLSLLINSCISNDDNISTFETELAELTTLKSEIEILANTSICNETSECEFIAFGSKPCGGPWSYLVYSTSIDTDNLENLVETYNQKESIFNQQWGIASDCALALMPTEVICENNTCIPIF